jgi:uncharacterized protein YjiS (DUF1127 family)
VTEAAASDAEPAGAAPERRPAEAEFRELLRRARTARAAALGAALIRVARCVGRCLAAAIPAPARSLIGRFAAWRRRERAAAALYAVDDRTLADLGLCRAGIAFILAQGGRDRPATLADRARRDACGRDDRSEPARVWFFEEFRHRDRGQAWLHRLR